MSMLRRSRLAVPLTLLAAWACGGGDLALPTDTGTPQIEAVQGDEQTGRPGTPLPEPLVVRLVDEAGDGIADRTIVWAVDAGGGEIDPATGTTDAEGFASAQWTLGPSAGPNAAQAEVPGVGAVTFTAMADEDDGGGGGEPEPEASRVEPAAGDDQRARAGTAVPVRPAVRVTDDSGEPVAGVEITFAVTGGGGGVDGAVQTTGPDGIARVGRWTLGSSPGTNTLEARAGSLEGSPVTFTAQATAAEREVDRLVYRVPPRDVRRGETFRVEVALVDAQGDVVPLSGIFVYLGLFPEGKDEPTNERLDGEHFENTEDGVAALDISVDKKGRYRLRALTDDLPELGPHGPEPYLYSDVFEVN